MDHCEAAFESRIKSLFGRLLLRWSPVLDDGFGIFNVDVAEMIIPILVDDFRRLRELAGGESDVDFCCCDVKLVEDPELGEGFMAILGGQSLGFEGGVDFA